MRGLILLQTAATLAAHLAWAAPPQDGGEAAPPQDGGGLNPDLCPASDGYFPDPFHCDKYYECVDGVPTEKICPDGQAFKDDNPKREVCEYLFNVECGLRTELQTPKATKNCPRANGYFAHPDDTICNEFYYCTDGLDAHNKCPEGLHFSKVSGNCGWKAQAGRTGCVEELSKFGFTCPTVNHQKAVTHPRYRNPADCKLFLVCFNGQGPPRESGCDLGLVFSEELEACTAPSNVPECANYYEEYFANYFATLYGAPADENHIAVASLAGYPVPEIAKKKPVVAAPPVNSHRRRTSASAAHSTRVTQLTSQVETAEEVTHRFESPVQSSRPNIRPATRPRPSLASRPTEEAAVPEEPAQPQAEEPRRRLRPGAGAKRRRKPTTTTTTTTTTPAPTTSAAPEYEYYYDDADYYYDEYDTVPGEGGAVVEEEPLTTTTTTTTTTTPPPTTTEPEQSLPRRRVPGTLSRRRPTRLRPGRREPEN